MTPAARVSVGLGLLIIGGAALAAMRRPAQIAAAEPDDEPAPAEELTAPNGWTFAGWGVDLWQGLEDTMTAAQANPAGIDQAKNVRAFLDAIAWAEGTARQPDPYRVCYGYSHTIADLSDHPAITGEWTGKRLPDAICKAAGKGPGCVSTAAGRYQILGPIWRTIRDRLGLEDFGPQSQDEAAIELLRESGALRYVQSGQFQSAVTRARRTWASLPNAGWGQPERSAEQFAQAFTTAGGVITA